MTQKPLTLLMIGDIVGRPGRTFLFDRIEAVVREQGVDFVIANGENSSGGRGISCRTAQELLDHGIHAITTGNHVFRNQDILKIIDTETRILRPLNYPESVPGRGNQIYGCNGVRLLVVNLLGRINLIEVDCPFQKIDRLLRQIPRGDYDLCVVDFHSETTSEKVAMGFFLEGRAQAVLGTHTHVQTADEKILPGGTAYITDVGMTGSFDSVIGVEKSAIIGHFLSRMPIRYKLGEEKPGLNSVIIEFDTETKKALSIRRFNLFS